jgi:uncharacterized membrane protein YfcA
MIVLALGVGSVAIGSAIGAVGVGGVLLVPMLLLVGGLPVHDAVAAAMWAYLFTGLAGTLVYGTRREIPWRDAAWIAVAAMPGALAGSIAVSAVDGRWLTLGLALLLGLAAADTLRGPAAGRTEPAGADPLSRGCAAAVGVLTGFGSSATGTSGPVFGLPLLLHLRVPAKRAVALCQSVQVPIAAFASAANSSIGSLDLGLASAIGSALAVGVIIGALAAPRLPAQWIRRCITIGLLVSMTLLLAGPRAVG